MFQPRIIVEGLDGSGKTSLINKIVTHFPDQVEVVPGFKHTQHTVYQAWLNDQFKTSPKIKVHDRFFYSELIYGPVIRGHSEVGPQAYQLVTSLLRQSAFLIYCRIPFSKIIESVNNESQMEGVLENLAELYDEYERVMMGEVLYYKRRFIEWDFTQHAIQHVMKPLERYVEFG